MSLDYAIMSKMIELKDEFSDMPGLQDMILKNKCFAYKCFVGEEIHFVVDFTRKCPNDINKYLELSQISIDEMHHRGMLKPSGYVN